MTNKPKSDHSIQQPTSSAAGLAAVAETYKHTATKPGLLRGISALLDVNQPDGFDCPGCAWPEDHRNGKRLEFCENGAKAIADETTRQTAGAEFFARYSLQELAEQSGRWLNDQGRLAEPLYKKADSDYYQAVSWGEAYQIIARELNALETPDQAVFYTSGRASNEAAFLYQLLVRRLGTNNLPDSSNLCHESSGIALTESLGSSKGSVSLEDFDKADAIFIFGQNPGSNHPRMLATLQEAKRRGATIVTINPLDETGLKRFRNPQEVSGYLTRGTALADLHVPVRINGDVALVKGLCKALVEAEADQPGKVLDHTFIKAHTCGFDVFKRDIEATSWLDIEQGSGVDQALIRQVAQIAIDADSSIACWAMGMTQHQNAVDNIQQIVNFMLLRGNVGRPGAGVCPVRGHSNVQGDRTVGITERPKTEFLQALGKEFAFTPPAKDGLHAVEAIQAMSRGQVRVFMALGGNFAAATPDPEFTERALQQCALTVQISTKLNRSHLIAGRQSLILPTLGRSDSDWQPSGKQFVTCENSMGVVSRSSGSLRPVSKEMRSEVRIVCELADQVFTDDAIDWLAFANDYNLIRERIERVVPGFENFNQRIAEAGEIILPHAVRDQREFATATGKAEFKQAPIKPAELAEDEYLMMTIRSHDQFNTTVYSDNDRYRGISQNRRVIFMHPDDIASAGFEAGDWLDLTSRFGQVNGIVNRTVPGFQIVAYPIPRGCAATYYPEANGLIPIDHFADRSFTPAYKSVIIKLSRAKSAG